MKVGVVMPVRNARPWIEEMLASVRGQTHAAGSYLAEDRSDDGTYEFLLDRPDLYTAMVRNEKRLGWPGGLNGAARLAIQDGCDAVFLASADDRLGRDCVARCVEAMEAGGHHFVIPWAQQFGGAHHVQASRPDATLQDLTIWPPMIDKALVRADAWEAVGGYSDDVSLPGSYGCAEDWDFWIKVWKAGLTSYAVIPTPLYFVRVHPDQLSNGRGELHAATVEIFKAKHPDLPWNADSGLWPPRTGR